MSTINYLIGNRSRHVIALVAVTLTVAQSLGQDVLLDRQEDINRAIERGVAFLRTANQDPLWDDGSPSRRSFSMGYLSLAGLTLLECGVPPNDSTVQKAHGLVREAAATATKTYDISLAILFLRKIGGNEDRAILNTLFLRLAAGQNFEGGWAYECPLLRTENDRQSALAALTKLSSVADPRIVEPQTQKGRDSTVGDNSNTQFAVLALGAHLDNDLPLNFVVRRVAKRFHISQQASGWGYTHHIGMGGSGPMTCAGILALAIEHAWDFNKMQPTSARSKVEDKKISQALFSLGAHLDKPPLSKSKHWPLGQVDLCYIWSVERTAVLCNVKTIGGQDWYRWGVDYILPIQRRDGSWLGHNCADSPVVSTCMALLFLKRIWCRNYESDSFPE